MKYWGSNLDFLHAKHALQPFDPSLLSLGGKQPKWYSGSLRDYLSDFLLLIPLVAQGPDNVVLLRIRNDNVTG